MARQQHNWDCGYANIMALLQTLARRRAPSAATSVAVSAAASATGFAEEWPTSIAAVQRTIVAAWRAGYDRRSAEQYHWRLLGKEGRAGWIGAPECLALLCHLRLDAFLVEVVQRASAGSAVYAVAAAWFALPSSSAPRELNEGSTSHATSRPAAHSAGNPALGAGAGMDIDPGLSMAGRSRRPPLYLQHQGHSRTLIGVLRAPRRLLVRDPKDAPLEQLRCIAPEHFDGKQWQIVGVTDRALSEEEALTRRSGVPDAAARWDRGRWEYSDGFTLRF